MSDNVNEVIIKIKHLKKKLAKLWELKGKTDPEILDIAGEIDSLLNKYDYLLKYSDIKNVQKRKI